MTAPFATCIDLLAALRTGSVSAVELLDWHLERLSLINGALNAVVQVNPAARGEAERADRRRAAGESAPLLGLPITVKDAIDVRGMPTSSGVRRLAKRPAERDAPAVARLRGAGAVIVGKTNTPPYAGDWQTENRLYGRTVNPWATDRTPGGSTGGGAAAVAAGLSPLELGSDIGGSIRLPAAFCGVFGHRPSAGLVPGSGHVPGSALPNPALVLNVLGPLTRKAEDLDLALSVLAGREGEASSANLPAPRHDSLGDFRVGLIEIPEWQPVESAVLESRDRVVRALEAAGATVGSVAVPGGLAAEYELFAGMLAAEFSSALGWGAEERERHAAALEAGGDPVDAVRAAGYRADVGDFISMLAERERLRVEYRALFRQWDVLLVPASLGPAFRHDDRPMDQRTATVGATEYPYFRHTVFAAPATVAGLPATVFPADSTGPLPVGLQAVGPALEDRTPIQFARLVAREIGGFRPPPMPA